MVEFDTPPAELHMFAAAFDVHLREHNRHYRIRRDPGVMDAPIVTVLPKGTCKAYLQRTRSRVSAQTKLLTMSPSRHVAEGLLEASAGVEGGERVRPETCRQ